MLHQGHIWKANRWHSSWFSSPFSRKCICIDIVKGNKTVKPACFLTSKVFKFHWRKWSFDKCLKLRKRENMVNKQVDRYIIFHVFYCKVVVCRYVDSLLCKLRNYTKRSLNWFNEFVSLEFFFLRFLITWFWKSCLSKISVFMFSAYQLY